MNCSKLDSWKPQQQVFGLFDFIVKPSRKNMLSETRWVDYSQWGARIRIIQYLIGRPLTVERPLSKIIYYAALYCGHREVPIMATRNGCYARYMPSSKHNDCIWVCNMFALLWRLRFWERKNGSCLFFARLRSTILSVVQCTVLYVIAAVLHGIVIQ
jgi:hypothetical protein